MVSLAALWLPIVLSAVLVFVASSVIHMVLNLHRKDYGKLPGEENVMAALRKEGVAPGNYYFPCPEDPKQMKSPEMMEKYKQGPIGFLNVMPSGMPAMGKFLTQWILYCLVVAFFVAYLTGRTQAPGADYLAVFRVAGTAAFMGYGLAYPAESIWKGQNWSTTVRFLVDALVYALLTAGVFGWLWP